MFDQDTNVTVFLDKIADITLHPLFGTRTVGGAPADRFRPRSMPLRNLNAELPSDLGLEPESMVSEVARIDLDRNGNRDQSQPLFEMVSIQVYNLLGCNYYSRMRVLMLVFDRLVNVAQLVPIRRFHVLSRMMLSLPSLKVNALILAENYARTESCSNLVFHLGYYLCHNL